jgi:hypothetical protein
MKKNLTCIAKNFEGSNGFRNYFDVNQKDILDDGDLSCAIYISTVLVMCRLTEGVSFTVSGLLTRIRNSDNFIEYAYTSIGDLLPGDIVVWDSLKDDQNKHVGIFLGGEFVDKNAISNRSSQGSPGRHSVLYTGRDKGNNPTVAKILKYFRLKEGV